MDEVVIDRDFCARRLDGFILSNSVNDFSSRERSVAIDALLKSVTFASCSRKLSSTDRESRQASGSRGLIIILLAYDFGVGFKTVPCLPSAGLRFQKTSR